MDTPQARLFNKVNLARAERVNKLIEENIPKWKVYFLKKSKFYARFFKIFTTIEPRPLLESDIIHEKLILCSGKPDNLNKIAEADFRIQDKRKIDEKDMKQSIKPGQMQPKNFDLMMGEGPNSVTFHMYVKPTLIHRFKWWLFCKFFPFKVVRWDKNIIKNNIIKNP